MLTSTDLIKIDGIVKRRVDQSVDKSIKKHLKIFEEKFVRKLNLLLSYFENEFVPLDKRVTRVEKHLNLN